MTMPTTIRHNQCTFIAIGISILLLAGFFGCHSLTQDLQTNAETVAHVAELAAPLAPPPYKEILIAISALLSSGLLVDNRRKDTVIKVLKSNNANKKK